MWISSASGSVPVRRGTLSSERLCAVRMIPPWPLPLLLRGEATSLPRPVVSRFRPALRLFFRPAPLPPARIGARDAKSMLDHGFRDTHQFCSARRLQRPGSRHATPRHSGWRNPGPCPGRNAASG